MKTKTIEGVCHGCWKTRKIVYKAGFLCLYCNNGRLQKQAYEKQKNKPKKEANFKFKKRKKPNQTSAVQANINIAIRLAYAEMERTREHTCTGCGTTKNLTHSHLIARSQRKDLETVLDNLTYHCIACHDIWEHGDLKAKSTLLDYERNLNYLRKTDTRIYELLINRK